MANVLINILISISSEQIEHIHYIRNPTRTTGVWRTNDGILNLLVNLDLNKLCRLQFTLFAFQFQWKDKY